MNTYSQARIVGAVAYVQLSHNKEAIIDAEDLPKIQCFRWSAYKGKHTHYAKRMVKKPDGKWTKEALHRRLMEADSGFEVDHINGDGLDNRKANLRVVTKAQNQWNSRRRADNKTGFKGVYFDRCSNKWRAVIRANKKRKALGSFDDPEKAYAAYVAASVALHSEYGRIV